MIVPNEIYVLVDIHPALQPDKRHRYDWRAAPMLTGMEFQSDLFEDSVLVLRALDGGYDVRVDRLPETFTDLLVRVASPTPSQYLRAQGYPTLGTSILDVLQKKGLITLDDVKRAVDDV